MKFTKTLSALTLVTALTFAASANAATNFAEQKFRLDTNVGFKITNYSVKDSSVHFNSGSFQLNLAGHYFVFNNNSVAVGVGAEAGASLGTSTIGGSYNHTQSQVVDSTVTTNYDRSYKDYNGGLSVLAQFNVENSVFTPYVQFSVGYQEAKLRFLGEKFKYDGVYTKLGAGVSWTNGFTAGAYVTYLPSQSSSVDNIDKASAYSVGFLAGWKF
ncbi:hypothetical protein CJP74_07075 [Psittacicella melopsittaci]|uniref:Outer membrane protein beta-barrel domain-containing protein n=1 Tax=Psittacicella melopsittaci TaxID=2028576 RepID=A0A3A1Y2I6_9GAMM|nr:hypothetical protein [Psittacicella melopsittaci]RIY31516.1 hypothetical protein CJP74_07075 [Psittacicella melopsittaci]